MRICILSTDNTPAGFLDSDVPDAMHFYDDKLHIYLTGTAHTFEFSVAASADAAELLTVGNKLAFYYKNRPYYLNIVSTSQTETEISVEAWAYCLELLNEKASAYAPAEAHTFAEYYQTMIYCNDIFEIGVNEVSTYSRKCEFTGDSDTLLKRLYSLASEFDAELEFVPRLYSDYSLDVFVMNVYKEHSDADQGVGERRTDRNYRYGIDIDGVTKTQDITDLYTMIVPTGKDGLTLSSIGERKVYNDEGVLEYYHPAGNSVIYAPRACQDFPSAVTSKDKYIRYDWSTDYESAESLYGNALAKLKEISNPASTYEIKGSIDVNIGDTVMIIDEAFTPSLYLETRVTEQEISFTDPSKNSTTFENTRELENQISGILKERFDALEKVAANAVQNTSSNQTALKNGLALSDNAYYRLFGVNSGTTYAAGTWQNFTSTNIYIPEDEIEESANYLIICSVTILPSADGYAESRMWVNGSEQPPTLRSRTTNGVKGGIYATLNSVFTWYGGTNKSFTAWPQVYASVSFKPASAEVYMIKLNDGFKPR